ncbi:MAG: hypothetical protein A2Y82_03540 [Candidatus Buchananbacteria bacterium RBG_13_36_9]|uniref:Uncharacterized protein n=1 Tax=Candidatus Buchananbacteria bacterium RBG_13_36_9 TaxID=1797530 RepID=A0A1G1XLF4_9BACT|nr:MAG: hypothetical protein A2Y82_03540 [Candidatus Buchananbacteria bacterium RBG_13_36_9]
MKKIKQWLDNLNKRLEKDKKFQIAVKIHILIFTIAVLLYIGGWGLPEIGIMYFTYAYTRWILK